MSIYSHGDYVKAEFRDEKSGEAEWMWLRVESCNDEQRIIFGTLDSVPLLDHGQKLKLGCHLAVSYDNIRQHARASEFSEQ